MNRNNKEVARSAEWNKRETRAPRSHERMKGAIAQILVLALLVAMLPAPARATWTDKSGSLPGIISPGEAAAIIAGGAVVIGLAVYLIIKHRRGQNMVKLYAPPVRFDNAVPGQPSKQSVPVTNQMGDLVTVKAVSVEDQSSPVAIGDAKQVPFTLAPGEKFEIPVTLSANNGAGKTRLKIVATTEKLKKDEIKFVNIYYGHQKSKLSKLVPKL